MNTSTLKEEIHLLVDEISDDEVLKAVQILLKPRHQEYQLSEAQIAELDKRMEDRRNGVGKSYTLEEVEQYFKDKKK